MNSVLCQLNDLQDQEAREFKIVGRNIVALRDGEQVYVYLNLCPHLGTPLNWEPNSFLDNEGTYLRCANHGALFIKETGECIQGPCRGMPLSTVPAIIENGQVKIELAPVEPYQPFPAQD